MRIFYVMQLSFEYLNPFEVVKIGFLDVIKSKLCVKNTHKKKDEVHWDYINSLKV